MCSPSNDVESLPLTIRFGNQEYLDGVDLSSAEFYEKIGDGPAAAITAQPAPAAFVETYRRLLEGGAERILSLHISAALSGTYNAASIGASMVDARRVTVMDTRSVSAGIAMLAIDARRRFTAGASFEEVEKATREDLAHVELFATVPSLTYLARGGRIGGVRGLVGNVLKIVPILALKDGAVGEHAKVRIFSRAVDQLVQTAIDRMPAKGRARIAILHSVAPELAASIGGDCALRPSPFLKITCDIGPTVGTHAGPGAVGVCFIRSVSGAPRWADALAETAAGVYVHIPFCDRICPYCDFAVVRTRRQTMVRCCAASPPRSVELHSRRRHRDDLPRRRHSFSAAAGTDRRADRGNLEPRIAIGPEALECTLEANPSRGRDDLERWREAGVNRLSVGVQSFDDIECTTNRDHSAAQASAFLDAARAAGFENVSLDLIAGAPGQTRASFEASLAAAIACPVAHISVYGLTIETGTPFASWYARNPRDFPDEELVADLLEAADAILSGAGFSHYEISNFARPGFESAHNSGYWRQRDCLAFGMSAAGYENGLRYANHRDFDVYCSAVEAGLPVRAYEGACRSRGGSAKRLCSHCGRARESTMRILPAASASIRRRSSMPPGKNARRRVCSKTMEHTHV